MLNVKFDSKLIGTDDLFAVMAMQNHVEFNLTLGYNVDKLFEIEFYGSSDEWLKYRLLFKLLDLIRIKWDVKNNEI